jgi:phosphoribosyl 1,2-cyclic phosphodiesterase
MVLQIQPLRSGSSGNSLLVSDGTTRILVDAGLTHEALAGELANLKLGFQDLAAVFVTHAHGDHLGCAGKVSRREKIPMIVSEDAARSTPMILRLKLHSRFAPGAELAIGTIRILTIPLSHDAPGTVACVLESGGARFGLATDLGRSSAALEGALAECDAFLLEFNHDEGLLREGPYPWRLKRRVLGDEGHLSNAQAAAALANALGARVRHVLLGHLSEINNRPELALEAARSVVARAGRGDVAVAVAPRGEAAPQISIP